MHPVRLAPATAAVLLAALVSAAARAGEPGPAAEAPAVFADFEPASGYAPGELVGQPGFSGATLWSRTGGGGAAAIVVLPEGGQVLELRPDARPYDTVRLRPAAADLGLAALAPVEARIRFSLRLRFPDLVEGDDTLTHVVSLFRDSAAPGKGRAVRLHLHRNGRVVLANSPVLLGSARSADEWLRIEGVADFGTRRVSLRLGESGAALEAAFSNEGTAGPDEYGYVELGSAASGVRLWVDDLDLAAAR